MMMFSLLTRCPVILMLFVFSITAMDAHAQRNNTRKQRDTTDLTFSGTKINPYNAEYDTTGKLTFSGYIDTYLASYHDTSSAAGFSKFPTISPRDKQVGINIVQASARYVSNDFRGTVTIFGGDVPQSSWSTHLNYIQEANLGFRIVKNLWLDAGFFRTHIGLESIQPRENIALSLATTTYFEPYFMSGAKLTWQHSSKLAIQINAFNSFNQFIETNKNKAVGLSFAYTPNPHTSLTFSSIVCDESPSDDSKRETRLYNNLCFTHKTMRWVIGLEGNYGIQNNQYLNLYTNTYSMGSALAAVKYRFTPKWAAYTRGEAYLDPHEILTGPVENGHHLITGLDIYGITAGGEFKPIPNSFVRLESRYIQTKPNEDIFYFRGKSINQRVEILAGIGVWF